MHSLAQKPQDSTKHPRNDIEFPTEFVLDNGLTVIVHEDHKAPIVAVNMWYHVGLEKREAREDRVRALFEHLMFGGSEHAPGRYIEAMEKIGATDLNGTTNDDRTNYFEDVPTSALDLRLWMESDRMGHLLGAFDQKTLDSAARRGAERKAPGRESALRRDRGNCSRRILIRPGIRIRGRRSATWPTWTRPR